MSVNELLNQTIVVYSKTSYNAQGREVVGSGVSVSARVQMVTKNVTTPTGAILTIIAKVFVGPDASVNVDDKITFSGQNFKVYNKYPSVGRLGQVHHYELQLIKWQAT